MSNEAQMMKTKAGDDARRARESIADLEERRRALAPAVLAGDADAELELSGVEHELGDARRSLLLSEAALEELGRHEEEAGRREEAEREEESRRAYDELAERRGSLEEAAQERLEALVETLEELGALDAEQLVASPGAGVATTSYVPWSMVLSNWLGGWLKPYLPEARPLSGYRKPLSELSPLPGRAPRPEEVSATQERNLQVAAESVEDRERLRRAEEFTERIIREFRESLAGRGWYTTGGEGRMRCERAALADVEAEHGPAAADLCRRYLSASLDEAGSAGSAAGSPAEDVAEVGS